MKHLGSPILLVFKKQDKITLYYQNSLSSVNPKL